MTDLIQIEIAEIASDLRDEIDSDAAEWTAWEHILMTPEGFVDGNKRLQILHHAEAARGGVVFVGSGSSGVTTWTDATTPEEVLRRYLADEMAN